MSRTIHYHHPRIAELTRSDYTADDLSKIETLLIESKTFSFPRLGNGLFPAALALQPELGYTGYQNVWLRDNMHIANAHYEIGKLDIVIENLEAFVKFYEKYSQRFDDCISGKVDVDVPQNRPHIRFDGTALAELPEKWAHAQNDALGFLLWMLARMVHEGKMEPSANLLYVAGKIVLYLKAIKYWQDQDSGHWEEARKIEASSVGVVLAGMKLWLKVIETIGESKGLQRDVLTEMVNKGQSALDEILPSECIQDDDTIRRRYDSALLFLIYPFEVVDETMARQIVSDVTSNLMGDYGIKRYLGDSYWCADYKDKLSPERRTTEFVDDMLTRDMLWREGEEAQWCIFDSIISTIYGRWYLQTKDPADKAHQLYHFHRSLSQLTSPECPWGEMMGPESYFLEHGKFIPNDITPLLWTHGNLRIALEQMKRTATAT